MKRIGHVLLGLVGALLVANAFMSWRVNRQFESRIAAIRKAGDPASIADLKPPPIPDNENAAVHLDRLTPRLEAFSREYGAFYKTPLGKQFEQLHDAPATQEQIEALRKILDQYTDLEQAITLASHCPAYGSTMDFSLGFQKFIEVQLDRVTRIRTIARMTDWRAQVLLADGLRDETVARWLAVLRLARLQEAEPSLMASLVPIAVRNVAMHGIHRALTDGPISAANHAEIEAELGARGRSETDRADAANRTGNFGERQPRAIGGYGRSARLGDWLGREAVLCRAVRLLRRRAGGRGAAVAASAAEV
jgi:hypothetical protein